MTQYLDLEGLKAFKKQADAAYLPIKGTIPLTDKINLTTETKASLALKYAKVSNNTINFYVIADSSNKLPSSETRININSDITDLVGAEGANVGDIFVIGKLNLLPVYKIIPLNDAKAENSDYKGTQGVVTPWDKAQINKVPNMESAINAAKNNLPTYSESNMNNALKTGFYPWCTLGRPSGSTGAYTLVTLASTTTDNNGYTTIEQTAYGRQNDELGKIFKRIIFKPSSGDTEYGEWKEITGSGTGEYYMKHLNGEIDLTDVRDAGMYFIYSTLLEGSPVNNTPYAGILMVETSNNSALPYTVQTFILSTVNGDNVNNAYIRILYNDDDGHTIIRPWISVSPESSGMDYSTSDANNAIMPGVVYKGLTKNLPDEITDPYNISLYVIGKSDIDFIQILADYGGDTLYTRKYARAFFNWNKIQFGEFVSTDDVLLRHRNPDTFGIQENKQNKDKLIELSFETPGFGNSNISDRIIDIKGYIPIHVYNADENITYSVCLPISAFPNQSIAFEEVNTGEEYRNYTLNLGTTVKYRADSSQEEKVFEFIIDDKILNNSNFIAEYISDRYELEQA